jgi:hypothetical protein
MSLFTALFGRRVNPSPVRPARLALETLGDRTLPSSAAYLTAATSPPSSTSETSTSDFLEIYSFSFVASSPTAVGGGANESGDGKTSLGLPMILHSHPATVPAVASPVASTTLSTTLNPAPSATQPVATTQNPLVNFPSTISSNGGSAGESPKRLSPL